DGEPARSVPLRLPGDAGRRLLRGPGHCQRSASPDAAVRHNELAAAHKRARSAVAALPAGEVWLQEPQAHRPHPLSGLTPFRLLGRPRLRLVCGLVSLKSSTKASINKLNNRGTI